MICQCTMCSTRGHFTGIAERTNKLHENPTTFQLKRTKMHFLKKTYFRFFPLRKIIRSPEIWQTKSAKYAKQSKTARKRQKTSQNRQISLKQLHTTVDISRNPKRNESRENNRKKHKGIKKQLEIIKLAINSWIPLKTSFNTVNNQWSLMEFFNSSKISGCNNFVFTCHHKIY